MLKSSRILGFSTDSASSTNETLYVEALGHGVFQPNDWAFSFWGGHTYLYVSQGSGSNVVDYDPASGNINPTYMTSIGFDIVGAGVSTCAPTMPPQ